MTQTSKETKKEFTISIPKPGIKNLRFGIAKVNLNFKVGQIIKVDGLEVKVESIESSLGEIKLSLKHE